MKGSLPSVAFWKEKDMTKQTIYIRTYSDSVGGYSSDCSGGSHHVTITLPNDSIRISSDDDEMTIQAKSRGNYGY